MPWLMTHAARPVYGGGLHVFMKGRTFDCQESSTHMFRGAEPAPRLHVLVELGAHLVATQACLGAELPGMQRRRAGAAGACVMESDLDRAPRHRVP